MRFFLFFFALLVVDVCPRPIQHRYYFMYAAFIVTVDVTIYYYVDSATDHLIYLVSFAIFVLGDCNTRYVFVCQCY